MSLLLDAMKKSGDNSQSSGVSKLTLEEHPAEKHRTPSSADSLTSSSRAAGENMFAAKHKKEAPRRRWKLGLVPTTLLICTVLGSGYGYYVWLEISPRPQAVMQRSAPPPAPPRPAPAPVPTSEPAPLLPLVATLAPKSAPEVTPQKIAPASEKVAEPAISTPRNKPRDIVKPREDAKPREAFKPRAPTIPSGMNIVRNQERDAITPALLDAYQAYQRGDYTTAAQVYREVLNRDIHNRDAMLGLAAIAQQKSQDETAQYYYRQVLLLDPRDPVALGALSAYGTSNGADPESQLKQRLSEQPRSGALNYALGNVFAEQSRWAEAQQVYFNARMLEPSNAQYTYNLAVSLDHLGKSNLAAQYYQQALQLDANNNSGFDHAKAQQRLNELTNPGR